VNKGLLQKIDQYMNPYGQPTPVGNGNLPVVCIKACDTAVAERIDDNTNGEPHQQYVCSAKVKQIICDLQRLNGLQVPIQVHTPERTQDFFGATGKLYSHADIFQEYNHQRWY
jgi:hypothetical protein